MRAVPLRTPRFYAVPVALGSWAAALVAVVVVGGALDGRGKLFLGAAPLSGQVRTVVPWAGLLLPATVAAVVVVWGPRIAVRLGPVVLPVATSVAAATWTVALALVDGPRAIPAPLTSPHDYLADLPRVRGSLSWLSSFAERVVQRPGGGAWTTHVAGHPPGALLLFWAADRVGLQGPGWGAVLLIAAGSSAAAAVVVAVRALGGPVAAASVAPLLALAPYALWIATSADAAFLAVSAWGAALLAIAVTRRPDRGAGTAAVCGGVLLGSLLYLSYGLVLFGAVTAAMLIAGGRPRVPRAAVLATAGVLLVVVAWTAAGFWWPAGLAATRTRWMQGVGSERSFPYTAVANLVVAGLAAGPAAVAALPRLRALPGRLAYPVVGALVAILFADASGMSRGEVERIWLPFLPWLLVGAVPAGVGQQVRRGWLVAQAGCALAVTAVVATTW